MSKNIAIAPERNNRNRKSGPPAMRPFRISWQGKSYEVTNIADYHTELENGLDVHVFTAADKNGTFKLKFSDDEMDWFLG